MRWSNPILALAAFAAGGCYGPVRDDSRITSTAIINHDKVAFTYHEYRYRPAVGLAAFPDGGIPKYVRDRFVVGVAGADGHVRVLARFDNPALPGAGSVGLRWYAEDPTNVYVTRYGQQTTSLPIRYFYQLLRMDVIRGTTREVDIRSTLAAQKRELGADGLGDFFPLTADGTLLVGATHGSQKELWLRSPSGGVERLLAFDRFDRRAGDDLIYSVNGPPFATYAFNWKTRQQRQILRYNRANTQQEWQARDDPAFRAITSVASGASAAESVEIGEDGKTLKYERNGQPLWTARVEF